MTAPRSLRTAMQVATAVVVAFLFTVLPLAPAAAAAATAHSADVAVSTAVGDDSRLVLATQLHDGGGRSTSRGICSGNATLRTEGLPVNRWSEGTSFHSRLGSKAWNDVAQKLQRQGVMELGMSFGNVVWATSAGMVEFATSFCVLDRAGAAIDSTAAKIAKALISSGLVVAVLAGTIVVYAWRMSRGAGAKVGKALFQKGLVLALFAIMMVGASNSSGGTATNTAYKPGLGSPGWFATTIDTTIASLASSVAGSVTTKTIEGADKYKPGVEHDVLSCTRYVKAMKDQYRELYGSGTYKQAANVPLLLSSMWEQTGLEAWKQAQFGNRNAHGDFMYCRMLEANTSQPVGIATGNTLASTQIQIMRRVDSGFANSINPRAMAWVGSSDNKERDRAYVAWAACRIIDDKASKLSNKDSLYIPDGREKGGAGIDKNKLIPPGFSGNNHTNNSEQRDACHSLFNKDAGDFDGGYFDWNDSDSDISKTLTAAGGGEPEAKDFLLTLHGNKNVTGIVSVIVYSFSALAMFAVFGLFSIAIIAAKVAALVMMLMVFFMMFATLLPNADSSKLVGFAKQYVGLSLFAFGAQFILAMISVVTSLLIGVGAATMPGGAGGLMSMIWTGVAPLIAVMCLHIVFKRMKMPSPFKMSSGMAWGQAAATGAIGGAAAGGVMGLMDDKFDNWGKKKAKSMGEATKSKVGLGGKGERRSTMTPDGAGAGAGAADSTGSVAPAGVGDGGAGAKSATAAGAAGAHGLRERAAAARVRAEAAHVEKQQAKAARQHAAQVAAAERDAIAAARAAERSETRGGAVGVAARDAKALLADAGRQFADRPFATTKSAAAKTAKVGAVAALVTTTGGFGGLALVGGLAATGRTKTGHRMLEAVPGVGASRTDRATARAADRNKMLGSYSEHLAAQGKAREAAVAAEQERLGGIYHSERARELRGEILPEPQETTSEPEPQPEQSTHRSEVPPREVRPANPVRNDEPAVVVEAGTGQMMLPFVQAERSSGATNTSSPSSVVSDTPGHTPINNDHTAADEARSASR